MIDSTKGFVKLQRGITDWEWFDDRNTRDLFIILLLKAQWEDKRYHDIMLPKGSLLTSYRAIAKDTGLTMAQLRTSLNHLKSTHEITCSTCSKYTIISLDNWEIYQSSDTQGNTRNSTDKTHSQHTDSTIQENKKKRNKEYTSLRKRNSEGVKQQSYDLEEYERKVMSQVPVYQRRTQ